MRVPVPIEAGAPGSADTSSTAVCCQRLGGSSSLPPPPPPRNCPVLEPEARKAGYRKTPLSVPNEFEKLRWTEMSAGTACRRCPRASPAAPRRCDGRWPGDLLALSLSLSLSLSLIYIYIYICAVRGSFHSCCPQAHTRAHMVCVNDTRAH